jgi:hypothetical protein
MAAKAARKGTLSAAKVRTVSASAGLVITGILTTRVV